jgi:hypothetical protein
MEGDAARDYELDNVPDRQRYGDFEWDGDSILEPDTADALRAALMEALASQSANGWKFIFRGALSKKWGRLLLITTKKIIPFVRDNGHEW